VGRHGPANEVTPERGLRRLGAHERQVADAASQLSTTRSDAQQCFIQSPGKTLDPFDIVEPEHVTPRDNEQVRLAAIVQRRDRNPGRRRRLHRLRRGEGRRLGRIGHS
jgi:hypothetical protein